MRLFDRLRAMLALGKPVVTPPAPPDFPATYEMIDTDGARMWHVDLQHPSCEHVTCVTTRVEPTQEWIDAYLAHPCYECGVEAAAPLRGKP